MEAKRKERQKKRAAFDKIVAEYESRLLRYVLRMTSNHELAQDVVQDTLIRLFRTWKEELKPSPHLCSWLYRVAHNRAVDYLRKDARRRELHKRQAEESPCSVPPNRGHAFSISEAAAKAADALSVLDLRERQLVTLKVYEERSYKEIAEIMGLSVGNVGYILHHAMRKLAAALQKERNQA